MILMNKKDLSLYKTVMMIKENDLHPYLVKMLEKKYKYHNVIDTPDFVIAEGNLPIYLLAHLDVVATSAPSNIIYDREQNIMSCLNGFGADDRNGVWTILKLLDKGYRPHIIFTHGEEVGGIGAESVIKIFPKMPYDAKYLVQLDRRGDDDCVFYDCDNPDFTKYIESFGFKEAIGSFTDISIIAPAWKVAAVNLSVGYRQEHSQNEHTYVTGLYKTLKRTEKMLKVIEQSPKFEYIEGKNAFHWSSYLDYVGGPYESDWCDNCKKTVDFWDLVEVVKLDGTVGYYCQDCAEKKCLKCTQCGEVWEDGEGWIDTCPYCEMEGEQYVKPTRYTSKY